jgi:hypothetical protein
MLAVLIKLILLAWVYDHIRKEDERSLHLPSSFKNKNRLQQTERFGDHIQLKKKNTLRIGFQNIGGFPSQRKDPKEDLIRSGLNTWSFDVFGLAETNLDWRLQPEENKLWTRTREWWEHLHISHSHNTNFSPITQQQFGGTAIFTTNDIAHRVAEKGSDPSELGRWTWTKLRGKNNHNLLIIAAYRPNPPSAGVMGVYVAFLDPLVASLNGRKEG